MNVSGSASSRSISSSPKRTNGNSGQQQYVSVGGNDDFNDEDRIEMGAMEEGFPIMANNSSESNNRRRGLAAKSQVLNLRIFRNPFVLFALGLLAGVFLVNFIMGNKNTDNSTPSTPPPANSGDISFEPSSPTTATITTTTTTASSTSAAAEPSSSPPPSVIHIPADTRRRYDFTASNYGELSADAGSPPYWIVIPDNQDDGYFLEQTEGGISIGHVEKQFSKVLVEKNAIKDEKGNTLGFQDFYVSPDFKFVMVNTNHLKGWRHSFFADYWVYSVQLGVTKPLTVSKSNKTIAEELGAGRISLSMWSPSGNRIAWVRDNDVFVSTVSVTDAGEMVIDEKQITTDGSKDIINGVADWVYEEEVLSSHDALWFSPDGKNLAFLKFNETLVPEYRLQKYESQRSSIYPEELAVKYPKPGYPNPTVTLHIASTTKDANVNSVKSDHAVLFNSAAKLFADDDRLIVEVKWSAAHDTTTTATNHPLLTRIMNRVQDIQHIFLISATTSIAVDPTSKKEVYGQEWKGELVRNETNKDNAWFQQLQPIRMLKNGGIGNSYLELKETEAGFTHIAYYDDFNATQPARWLTTGEWEVTDISSIDEEKGIVYFISTEEGSIQRHLYSVHMDAANTKKKLTPPSNIPHTAVLPELEWPPASTPIVKNSTDAISTTNEVLNGEKLLRLRRRHDDGDDIYNNLRSRSPAPRPFPIPPPDKQLGVIGFWEARFSPKSKYYHLRYTGPDVPFSKIIGVETNFNHDMEGWGGDKARRGIQFYNLPLTKYLTIKNAVGDDINVKLTTPPGYDPTGTTQKYPVLLRVYGGPNSQMVQATYEFGFMSAVANMGVVVLVVDGRGTGYKGRAFRACVNRQLGSVEVEDQIAAGKWAAALPFVDATRIGIWGWSYGGYMAAKVLEADSGVFSMAMSVAPVTDWLFYDSIYTERYMKTPAMNRNGYTKSAVNNMLGFKNPNVHFLLVHGTADDNVHFQNSADLIWKFTGAHVHSYRMQTFTDSDHNMSAGGANSEIWLLLRAFINTQFFPSGGSSDEGIHHGMERFEKYKL